MPSKPRKRPEVCDWLSLRMMRRRRPGAGWQGAVEGGSLLSLSETCLR
jgi:hypothetical protein